MKNVILPFVITLTAVLCVGVGGLYIAVSPKGEQNPAENEEETTTLVVEAIPEHEMIENEATADKIEEAVTKYGHILADEAYMRENHISALQTKDEDCAVFTFAGDILFDANYSVMSRLIGNGGDITAGISPEVIQIMKDADLCMVNNEFPYSDQGAPLEGKQFTFRAKPETVHYLKDMGVDLVSLANNHAYDYGEAALLDTLDILEAEEILYVGAGRDKAEAQRTKYFITNDVKVAVLSATQIEKGDTPDTKGATDTTPGVFRCWHNEALLEQIKEAKANADVVICYIHWGTENTDEIDWAQDVQMPQMVDAGVDLIVGDHPHCLQKIDVYNGVPVVYSLGNFWFNSKTVDTGLLQVKIGAEGIRELSFVPCLQMGCKTSLLYDEEKQRVLQYLQSISPNVTIDGEGIIHY